MFHGRTTEEVFQEYLRKGGEPMNKIAFVRAMLKAYPEYEVAVRKLKGKSVHVFRRKGEGVSMVDAVSRVKGVFGNASWQR